MTDDMLFPEGADIPVQRFILPRVEVELAFILGCGAARPEREHLRRAGRHRLRGARAGDH